MTIHLFKEEQKEEQKTPKILVGTPCYGGLLHQDYVQALIEFNNIGIPITYMHIGNESLITRGRNTIISFYYAHMAEFTHLFFMDADIYLSANDLIKMIQAEQDVVAAAVPMKGFNPDGSIAYNITGIVTDKVEGNPNLVEVERVGTAALLLSNNAVNSLVEQAKENNDVYNGNSLSRGVSMNDINHYDVFKAKVVNGVYLAEDYYVCNSLRELGYNIYVDKTIHTKHSGSFTFEG